MFCNRTHSFLPTLFQPQIRSNNDGDGHDCLVRTRCSGGASPALLPCLSRKAANQKLTWIASVSALGLFACGFCSSNMRANRLHKLRTQLERAQSRLLQQARAGAVGNLVTGMAHEIGNPLNLACGGTEKINKLWTMPARLKGPPSCHGLISSKAASV